MKVKWLDQKQENIYFSKGKRGFVAIYINEEIDNNIGDKYKINRDKVILGNRLWEMIGVKVIARKNIFNNIFSFRKESFTISICNNLYKK